MRSGRLNHLGMTLMMGHLAHGLSETIMKGPEPVTNAIDPNQPEPPKESRQVRRARKRREKK